MADEETRDASIKDADVVTKYRAAGDISNRALTQVVAAVKEGASALALSQLGDKVILDETAKIYNKGKIAKGIAFPTCISVNNCICHFSPLVSDPDVTLKAGDVVKIDLGTHVDGLIAVVAHTVVVGASATAPSTGRRADVVLAAYNASEAALRLLKPGTKGSEITDIVGKVADAFKCKPVEGMLTHSLKQDVIDGEKTIIQNPNDLQRKDHKDCTVEVNDVFAMDVLISTSSGKSRVLETRTTVYKRTGNQYQLKMKAARAFNAEAQAKFGNLPFSLRNCEDANQARLGVTECAKHNVMDAFNVLYEKDDEFVAQFKFTALITANGTIRITGIPFDAAQHKAEHSVQDESLKALLASSANRKAKKPAAKKEGEAAPAAAPAPAQ